MFRSAVVLLLVGTSAVAADPLPRRSVTVTGTSVTRVAPDIVVWSITSRHTNRDLPIAQQECQESVRRVLAMAKDLKIKSQDMQTGYLSIRKVFDRDRAGNQTSFRHFSVYRVITFRQRDLTQFDEILKRLVGDSDLEVNYSLESSKFTGIRTQTRLDAVKAAKKKANEMTTLLGAKLGRVLQISEPGSSYPRYNSFANNAVSFVPNATPDDQKGTFAPGTIEIRVSITVKFELE